jgi:hypothetical protein
MKPQKPINDAELTYIVCAYCREFIDVKQGSMYSITHGICPDCYKKEMKKIEEQIKNRQSL